MARQVGVSHNAPYHHFADKAELVVALTIEGFHALERTLRLTYEQTTGTSVERILAISSAYIRFALEHPAIFNLMFRPELRQSTDDASECDEAVKRAADATFQVLLDGIAVAQQAGELRTDRPVEMLALAIGSTMHGLMVLLLDGLMVQKKAATSLEETEQLMAHVVA